MSGTRVPPLRPEDLVGLGEFFSAKDLAGRRGCHRATAWRTVRSLQKLLRPADVRVEGRLVLLRTEAVAVVLRRRGRTAEERISALERDFEELRASVSEFLRRFDLGEEARRVLRERR